MRIKKQMKKNLKWLELMTYFTHLKLLVSNRELITTCVYQTQIIILIEKVIFDFSSLKSVRIRSCSGPYFPYSG